MATDAHPRLLCARHCGNSSGREESTRDPRMEPLRSFAVLGVHAGLSPSRPAPRIAVLSGDGTAQRPESWPRHFEPIRDLFGAPRAAQTGRSPGQHSLEGIPEPPQGERQQERGDPDGCHGMRRDAVTALQGALLDGLLPDSLLACCAEKGAELGKRRLNTEWAGDGVWRPEGMVGRRVGRFPHLPQAQTSAQN